MAVVTISRQYGAGGHRLARAVAEALSFRLADRELVDAAAGRLGIDPDLAKGRDERVPALVEELGLALAAGTPELGATPALDDRALAEATAGVIESLADAGRYVILGRGGQAILSGRSDACHLALVGEEADRVKRVMQWQGLDERDAREQCRRMDADRAADVAEAAARRKLAL